MKKVFDSFQTLKSCTFVGINGYNSKTSGDVANYTLNVNISVENAKQADLKKLENCDETSIKNISELSGIGLDICKLALSELLTSAKKNLSENIKERSNQSQAISEAYVNITPSIKLHKESLQVYIFGQIINKTLITKGEHKPVKSSSKTIAKNAIKKSLNLSSHKFREFCLGNIDAIKIKGETIEL
jgi:hypothetical protein